MKTHSATKLVKRTLLTFALLAALTVAGVARAQVTTFNPGTSAIIPIEQQVETGPVLDVVPYVLSDGYTINLTLIPSLTEFSGYQNPPPVPTVTGGLNVVQLPTILPEFTVRQVVTTVNIWDGQTVMLGGLISTQDTDEKDKVPVLGDLPLLGKLFQSQSKVSQKMNLMIFVTATIVDPAGNRVHSPDELPFAQNSIPAQPANAGQGKVSTQTVPLSELQQH